MENPLENQMGEKLEEFFSPLNTLIENISSDDPLGMVIRGHLYIEAELVALIEDHLPYPHKIDLTRLTFPVKLDLAASMGLFDESGEEDEKEPYYTFNKLRNKLAHNINMEISLDDIIMLYEAFHMGHQFYLDSRLDKGKPSISGLRQCIIALFVFLNVKRMTMKGILVEMMDVANHFIPANDDKG
jgi:hypothetical protein